MTQPGLSRAAWHKSSYSNANGECVEIARNLPGVVAIRDSKQPAGAVLLVSPGEWQAFLADVNEGRRG
ncbi:MAG: DUF397 domain-containing protein [Streptosporangiaceae bacterium]